MKVAITGIMVIAMALNVGCFKAAEVATESEVPIIHVAEPTSVSTEKPTATPSAQIEYEDVNNVELEPAYSPESSIKLYDLDSDEAVEEEPVMGVEGESYTPFEVLDFAIELASNTKMGLTMLWNGSGELSNDDYFEILKYQVAYVGAVGAKMDEIWPHMGDLYSSWLSLMETLVEIKNNIGQYGEYEQAKAYIAALKTTNVISAIEKFETEAYKIRNGAEGQ